MIEDSYLMSRSNTDPNESSPTSQNKSNNDSVYFARIHDSSDVKKLADELRDLMSGKEYDKYAEKIKKDRIMNGIVEIVDLKKYKRPNFGERPGHKAPITTISNPQNGFQKKDPNLGPYELYPQTDMFYIDNNGERKIKTSQRTNLRNTISQDLNPYESQTIYPGEVVNMLAEQTDRMMQNDAMNGLLNFASNAQFPVRPPPVAPVYDVLVTGEDGIQRRQPVAPVVSIKNTPLMTMPSSKATQPILSTVREPNVTAKQLVVENKPIGPPQPLTQNPYVLPQNLQAPMVGSNKISNPLLPSHPFSIVNTPLPLPGPNVDLKPRSKLGGLFSSSHTRAKGVVPVVAVVAPLPVVVPVNRQIPQTYVELPFNAYPSNNINNPYLVNPAFDMQGRKNIHGKSIPETEYGYSQNTTMGYTDRNPRVQKFKDRKLLLLGCHFY